MDYLKVFDHFFFHRVVHTEHENKKILKL